MQAGGARKKRDADKHMARHPPIACAHSARLARGHRVDVKPARPIGSRQDFRDGAASRRPRRGLVQGTVRQPGRVVGADPARVCAALVGPKGWIRHRLDAGADGGQVATLVESQNSLIAQRSAEPLTACSDTISTSDPPVHGKLQPVMSSPSSSKERAAFAHPSGCHLVAQRPRAHSRSRRLTSRLLAGMARAGVDLHRACPSGRAGSN